MSRRRWVGVAGVGAGALTAAAATAGLVARRRVARARRAGERGALELGRLHGTESWVVTDDGLKLYAEIDEVAPYASEDAAADPGAGAPTLVFVHGYGLNLECWQVQRQYFRGKHRMLFFDQRSHGRSERSPKAHATIDQLGRDLLAVLDQLVPEGRVVLLGHSMGGMSIMALAEQHPELFGPRVAGTALLSTTAGGMRTSNVLSPLIPESLGLTVGPRLIASLARTPELVDGVRRRGSNLGFLITDKFAFGDDVPAAYVEFVDEMLSGTPFEVFADFFPEFDRLDKWPALAPLADVPTTVICGTRDLLTPIGHSRKLASRIPGSRLVECHGAGHLVILEQAERVNGALAELFAAAS